MIDPNLKAFLRAVDKPLSKSGAVHSFLVSLARKFESSGQSVYRSIRGVDRQSRLIVAGLQTSADRALILSRATDVDAREFARVCAEKVESIPFLNGPSETVTAFAREWSERKCIPWEVLSEMRLFELHELIGPRAVPGTIRRARLEDQHVMFEWLRAFHQEAVPNDPVPSDEELRQNIRGAIENGFYFIWDVDGVPVSLVGSTRETPRDRWIAPVYTPVDQRGRGYASALVAGVSRKILDSGRSGLLFTDLANPTSNKIYQELGYRAVADFRHIRLGKMPGADNSFQ